MNILFYLLDHDTFPQEDKHTVEKDRKIIEPIDNYSDRIVEDF